MSSFEDPFELIKAQDLFGNREVGLNHPDVPGFIRIRDNGDLEIVAGEGLSILMSARSRSITFVADSVKFITKKDGLKWNKNSFNPSATQFNEPTLVPIDDAAGANHLYRDVDYFTDPDSSSFAPLSDVDDT